MNNKEILDALDELLISVLTGHTPDNDLGICDLVKRFLLDLGGDTWNVDRVLIPHFALWEHYSGRRWFPIPGGEKRFMRGRLWSDPKQREYRISLLCYLIREIYLEELNNDSIKR